MNDKEITDRFSKLAKKYEQYWYKVGKETIRMVSGGRYVALPEANLWTRLKVKWKNFWQA